MAGARDTEARFEVNVSGIDKLSELNEMFNKTVSAAERVDSILSRGLRVNSSNSGMTTMVDGLNNAASKAKLFQENLTRSNSSLEKIKSSSNGIGSSLETASTASTKLAEGSAKAAQEQSKTAEMASKAQTAYFRSVEAAEKVTAAQNRSVESAAKVAQAQSRASEYATKAASAQEKETAAIAKSVAQADKLASARQKDLALAEKYNAQAQATQRNASKPTSSVSGGGGRIGNAFKDGLAMFGPSMLIAGGVMSAAEGVKNLVGGGWDMLKERQSGQAMWETSVSDAHNEVTGSNLTRQSESANNAIMATALKAGNDYGEANAIAKQIYSSDAGKYSGNVKNTQSLLQGMFNIQDANALSTGEMHQFRTAVGNIGDLGKMTGMSAKSLNLLDGKMTRAIRSEYKKENGHELEKNNTGAYDYSKVSAALAFKALDQYGNGTGVGQASERFNATLPGMLRAGKSASSFMTSEVMDQFGKGIGKGGGFSDLIKKLSGAFTDFDSIKGLADNAANHLTNAANAVGKGLLTLSNVAQSAWKVTEGFRSGYGQGFVDEFNKIKSAMKSGVSMAKDLYSDVKSMIPKGTGGVLSGFSKDVGDFTGKVSALVLAMKGMSKLPVIGGVFDGMLGKLGGIVGKLPLVGGMLQKIIGGNKLVKDTAGTNMLRASDQMLAAAGKMSTASTLGGLSSGTGALTSGLSAAGYKTRTAAREAAEATAYATTMGGKFEAMAAKGNATLGKTKLISSEGEALTRAGLATRTSNNAGFIARQAAKVQRFVGTTGEKIVTSGLAKGLTTMGTGLKSTGKFLGKGMPGMNALFAGLDAYSVISSTKSGTKARDAGLGNAVGNGVGATIGGALGSALGPLGTIGGGMLGGWLGGKAGSWYGTSIHKDDKNSPNAKVTPTQALEKAQAIQANEDFINAVSSSTDAGGMGVSKAIAKKDYKLLGKAQKSNSVDAQKAALDYQRALENGDAGAAAAARDNLNKWQKSVIRSQDIKKGSIRRVSTSDNNQKIEASDSPLAQAIKKQNKGVNTGPTQFKTPKKSTTPLGNSTNDESTPLQLAFEHQHKGSSGKGGGSKKPSSKKPSFKKPTPRKGILGGGGGGTSPLADALKKEERQSGKTNSKVKSGSKKTANEVKHNSNGIKLNAEKNNGSVLNSGKKTSSALSAAAKKSSSEIKKSATEASKGQKKAAESAAKASVAAQKKAAQSTLKDMKKQGSDLEKALKKQSSGQKTQLNKMKSQQKTALSSMNKSAQKSFKSFAKQTSTAMKNANKSVKSGTKSMSKSAKSGIKSIETQFKKLNSSIKSSLNKTKSTAKSGVKAINNNIKSGFKNIGNVAKAPMNKLTSSVKSGMNKAKSAARSGSKGIGTAVKNGLKNVGNAGKSEFNKLASSVKSGMSKAKSAATSGARSIGTAITSGMKNVSTAGRSAMNTFSSSIRSGMSKANSAAKSGANQIVSSVRSGLSKLDSASSSAFNKMSSSMTSSMNKVSSTATSGMAKVASAVTAGMSKVTSAVQTGGAKAVSVMTAAFTKMASAGTSASSKVASSMSSIGSSASAAAGKVNALASAINGLRSKTVTITANVEGKGASKLESGTSGAQMAFSNITPYATGTSGAGSIFSKLSIGTPKYASGSTSGGHKGGMALVNDAKGANYREAFMLPDGTIGLFPKRRNVLVSLPKGAHVLNGDDTRRKFGAGVTRYAKGTSNALQAVNTMELRSAVTPSKKQPKMKMPDINITVNIQNAGNGAVDDITKNLKPQIKKAIEDIFRAQNSKTVEVQA